MLTDKNKKLFKLVKAPLISEVLIKTSLPFVCYFNSKTKISS